MTIKYDRLMDVKPGSMPAVLEMGPKFPELAKKYSEMILLVMFAFMLEL